MGYLATVASGMIIALGMPSQPPVEQEAPGSSAEPQQREDRLPVLDPIGIEVRRHPTAEELLKELHRERPVRDWIRPANASQEGRRPSPPDLLPEGTNVVSQTGRLVRQDHWWALAFEPGDEQPATKLLPNTSLEVMVRTFVNSPSSVKFTVSGEMTVFEDENYLLVRHARRSTSPPRQTAARPADGVEQETVERDKTPGDEQADPSEAEAQLASADASAEDVVSLLRQRRQAEQRLPAEPAPPVDPPSQGAAATRTLTPEGTPLVNRPGRLIRQGEWWTFAFESDHPDHPEPPMKLLPNKSAELMALAAGCERNGLVFLVSGEVTVFQSENYLLPRVAMRRIDAGNLTR